MAIATVMLFNDAEWEQYQGNAVNYHGKKSFTTLAPGDKMDLKIIQFIVRSFVNFSLGACTIKLFIAVFLACHNKPECLPRSVTSTLV
jgi:hypothetical protein